MNLDAASMLGQRIAGDKLLGGTLVGGAYELLEPLDAGAIGVIYVARQTHLGRRVAVKLIREPYASSPQFVGSLLREARAGSLIEHPNVARTYDFGYDDNGRCFLVMELLAGKPLVSVIQRVPRPPVEWTVSIVAQVLAGVGAAHDRGVIHRDVKPENVVVQTMLGDDGVPTDVAKLCDFGIAAVPGNDILGEDGRPLTFEGKMCGTPNYMSPEQAQGSSLDLQTDIYSCGVLLYELATGRLPFYDESVLGLAEKHVHQAPPRPREICPDLDPELERIILKAMAKRPEARYASARAMRAELLALECAKSTTSLLEDWADEPDIEAVEAAARGSDQAWRFEDTAPQLTLPRRKARFAVATAVACFAVALCATFAWEHLAQLKRWWTDLDGTAVFSRLSDDVDLAVADDRSVRRDRLDPEVGDPTPDRRVESGSGAGLDVQAADYLTSLLYLGSRHHDLVNSATDVGRRYVDDLRRIVVSAAAQVERN